MLSFCMHTDGDAEFITYDHIPAKLNKKLHKKFEEIELMIGDYFKGDFPHITTVNPNFTMTLRSVSKLRRENGNLQST